MVQASLKEFQELLSDLNAAKPPAPQQIIRRISEMDFNLIHAHEPDLLVNLILRLTADSICACYDLTGSARTDYRQSIQLVSKKLSVIARGEVGNSELVIYLSKLDVRLAEFDL